MSAVETLNYFENILSHKPSGDLSPMSAVETVGSGYPVKKSFSGDLSPMSAVETNSIEIS